MHMPIHTPFKPILGARKAASGIRTAHMLIRLMQEGARVSPAPRNTPLATMDAPNIGSAKASIRSTAAPSARTSGSGVRIPIICDARMNISAPLPAIKREPKIVVSHPNLRTRSFLPAPML